MGEGNQTNPRGVAITKTLHIGCRYGYRNLKWDPKSPMFNLAGASGLTVRDFQNVILVNQVGQRIWNELDEGYDFLSACLGPTETSGKMAARRTEAVRSGPFSIPRL